MSERLIDGYLRGVEELYENLERILGKRSQMISNIIQYNKMINRCWYD